MTEEEAWYVIDQEWLTDEVKGLICKAIVRLPADVREFAVNNCSFINFGGADHGCAYPSGLFTHPTRRGRTMRNHWVIVLNHCLTENEDDGQFTIAHEIAHARLGHQPLDGNHLAEEQADDLVKSWGFQIPEYRHEVHAYHRRAMERGEREEVHGEGAK